MTEFVKRWKTAGRKRSIWLKVSTVASYTTHHAWQGLGEGEVGHLRTISSPTFQFVSCNQQSTHTHTASIKRRPTLTHTPHLCQLKTLQLLFRISGLPHCVMGAPSILDGGQTLPLPISGPFNPAPNSHLTVFPVSHLDFNKVLVT